MVTKRRQLRHIVRRPLLRLGGACAAVAVVALAVVGLSPASGPAAKAASTTASASVTPAASTSGIATHYVLQAGGGNCSYPGPPKNRLFVALPPSEYASAAPCGSYLEVTGPGGSVKVKVIDQCPECKPGHIDLSEAAFAKLAPLVKGIINVKYHTIANPPLPGPVAFVVKSGSSQYWLALVVINTGNAIASVQIKTAGGWQKLSHTNWNAWIAQQGAGPGPFTIRVTDKQKHQVSISHVLLKADNKVQPTKTWMYYHS